ncbi:hypothetical protein OEV98_10880 [Caldibacillus lycopersici]|uniref:LexA repressor DNA-binding domain-containing protein n=1 Tax=Perspicuibacillus lycopersici TaxID=1325689 RepID=A0AAE3IT06_9BACI|nr:hypothetical protein [Perspicuibacillus lycopersici]MCU9614063.1 hypothetical protein [Perspicuibacillus lycopersici]
MFYYEEEHISRADRMKKQEEEIYTIIKDFIMKNKYSPSILEITKKSSVASKSTVFAYMHRLKNKGLIDWKPGTPRSISLTTLTEKAQ